MIYREEQVRTYKTRKEPLIWEERFQHSKVTSKWFQQWFKKKKETVKETVPQIIC